MLNTSSSMKLQVERIATLLGAACLGKLHACSRQDSRISSSGTQTQAQYSHLLVSEDIYLVSGQQSAHPVCWSSSHWVIFSAQDCQASLVHCLRQHHTCRGCPLVTLKPSMGSRAALFCRA